MACNELLSGWGYETESTKKMKIFVLPKTGIQESEKYAVGRIEKTFPKEWRGYASLEVIEKGRLAREIDLVLLLPDRILVVELKRWHGQIKSEDGYWYRRKPNQKHFERMDVSPVKKNFEKARILKTFVERSIKGGHAVLVDSRVVLCGNSPSPILTEEERPSVLHLDDFLEIGDPQTYKRLLELPLEFRNRSRTFNPLDHLNEFELLFKGSPELIRAREFSWQNYVVDGAPTFKHPESLYFEYRSVNRDDPNARALLRRWDFSQLGTSAPTQSDWVNIALREPRVFSYVKEKTDLLDGVLLQPIGTLAADEVTIDHCELFDLPAKQKRLFDFIEAYRDKLPLSDRVSLTKVLISKFAELHHLGVAHRDIGDHCIWLERPDSVRLSGFVASHFPQMETVGALKEQVSCITEKLPEDFFEDKFATPFHRDVYLLGVVAHILIYGVPPDRDDDGLSVWVPKENDSASGKLDHWFERCMKWETSGRWANAEEMLDALNELDLSDGEPVISLATFDYFKAQTRPRDYEELDDPVEKGNLEVFKGERDGTQCQVKFWFGATPDATKPDFNQALLRFLEKARAIQVNPSEWLPRVLDVGIVPKKGLLYVREWLDLPTLTEWDSASKTLEDRIGLSMSLVDGIERLHSIDLPHGDLHPENVLVRPAGEGRAFPCAVFIDTPDFKDGTVDVVTTAYVPANYERISLVERDKYAITLIIGGILCCTSADMAVGELPIPAVYQALAENLKAEPAILTLAPLKEALEKALEPPLPEQEALVVTISRTPSGFVPGPMRSDNGVYYVEKGYEDAQHEKYAIIGPGLQLTLSVSIDDGAIKRIGIKEITHDLFQRKTTRGIQFEGKISLTSGPGDDASALVWALQKVPALAARVQEQTKNVWLGPDVDAEVYKERTEISTASIWRHLIEAEFDSQPEVLITGPSRPHPKREDTYLIPFKSDVTIEYASDEKVEVLKEIEGGEYRCVGFLEHRHSTPDELAIVPRGFSAQFPIDSRYLLRSKAERSSYERRYEAVERILSGRSVIANLVSYFERATSNNQVIKHPEPTDADLEDYDVYEDGKKVFSLNDDQKAAFKRIVSSGPVCLLQGPPGTGKTSFIGAFLDYVIHKQGARSVLLVSQSHEATNNALEGALRLAARRNADIDVVRVGEDGKLSDAIRHVGVTALQESYRERFRSEFKHRIVSLSSRLRLNREFVEAFAQTFIHMDRLAEDVALLEKELAASGGEEEGGTLKQRLFARRELLHSHALVALMPEEIAASENVVEDTKEALARQFGVRNPAAVNKLHQLIKISQEWVDVLGSQGGNFSEFLAKTRTIVAGTCVGVGRWNLGVSRNSYDWVVIDEAARATPSDLAVSMQVGKRILLVGDHFQLPPLYKDELRKEMGQRLQVGRDSDVFDSDFERAFESPYGKAVGATLSTQYRMAPEICSLVSKCFYEPRDKKLAQGRGGPKGYFGQLADPFDSEVVWVDTSCAGKQSYHEKTPGRSCANQYEARAIIDVLRHVLQNEQFTNDLVRDLKQGEIPIGIIAMYSAQVTRINNAIARAEWLGPLRSLIKVDTVDGYQGKENRIIILSLVRNNAQYEQGFLSSPNRLNVAMSRAMDRLVIIGAMRMWKDRNTESPLGNFVRSFEEARGEKRVCHVTAERLKN